MISCVISVCDVATGQTEWRVSVDQAPRLWAFSTTTGMARLRSGNGVGLLMEQPRFDHLPVFRWHLFYSCQHTQAYTSVYRHHWCAIQGLDDDITPTSKLNPFLHWGDLADQVYLKVGV